MAVPQNHPWRKMEIGGRLMNKGEKRKYEEKPRKQRMKEISEIPPDKYATSILRDLKCYCKMTGSDYL